MKKYIFMAVAAIAALSSCSSDNDPIMGETGETAKQALTFTASMEGSATRATYNSTEKCASWEVGDQISVNGVTYNAQSAGLTTTFKAATTGQEAEGPTYNAYFACTYDGTTATLPAAVSETWAEGKFNMPMYATSTTTDLQFKNLCGVLKITVTSDQIAAVKKIKISSANKAISGNFTVDANNAAVLVDAENEANKLIVTYSEAVPTTAGGKVFYVAVPAQTYQKLRISLSADGNSFTKSMTTKAATDITVARNKIYPITFADNAPITTGTAVRTGGIYVNWVQLWENGPKFAEYNVGVEDGKAESSGGYYSWGSSIDRDPNGPNNAYKTGNDRLTGEDDTATNLWGKNWRMPTQAEFWALIANCNVTWKDNYNGSGNRVGIFTGKGDYENNSVILPAVGFLYFHDIYSNGRLDYWSSDPFGDNKNVYHLYSNDNGNPTVDIAENYFSFSVRAVLRNMDTQSYGTPGLSEENKFEF